MTTQAEIKIRNRRARALKANLDDFQAQPDAPGSWDDALVRAEQRIAQKQVIARLRQRLAGLGHVIETRADYDEWVTLCTALVGSPKGCSFNMSHEGYTFLHEDPRLLSWRSQV
jgi:hypothetical protein